MHIIKTLEYRMQTTGTPGSRAAVKLNVRRLQQLGSFNTPTSFHWSSEMAILIVDGASGAVVVVLRH